MGSDAALCFTVQEDILGPVVRLHGELDLAASARLGECLSELTSSVVTLDFSAVTFMDASGINLLVALQRHVREDGGKLVLFGLRSFQLRLLHLVGLSDHFDLLVPD
jgi:stage II sporulation protein AA (anti-sigma F factor antagonist)